MKSDLKREHVRWVLEMVSKGFPVDLGVEFLCPPKGRPKKSLTDYWFLTIMPKVELGRDICALEQQGIDRWDIESRIEKKPGEGISDTEYRRCKDYWIEWDRDPNAMKERIREEFFAAK